MITVWHDTTTVTWDIFVIWATPTFKNVELSFILSYFKCDTRDKETNTQHSTHDLRPQTQWMTEEPGMSGHGGISLGNPRCVFCLETETRRPPSGNCMSANIQHVHMGDGCCWSLVASGLLQHLLMHHLNTVVMLTHRGSDILPPDQPDVFTSAERSVLNPVTQVTSFCVHAHKRDTVSGLQ